MSYGTPTPDAANAEYSLGIQHKTEPEFFFAASFRATGMDGFTEQERDNLFQEFVDFVAGSANYNVTGASKGYTTSEEITPTP